ncbi:PIG-L family deacetylase [Frankia sp. B2]|nr:PIG-L family deacetylase [Frankia sp. B2]
MPSSRRRLRSCLRRERCSATCGEASVTGVDGTQLIVSPHLDDAALSAGAWIAELASAGTEIHVLTLFAGFPADNDLSPVARDFHDRCGLPHNGTAFEIRRGEDAAALTILGAHAHHADFHDAIYRRRPDRAWHCTHGQAMFDTSLPAEPNLRSSLEAAIETRCHRLRPTRILTCAGIGHHVDHRATRDAALSVAGRLGIAAETWEDLPYAAEATAERPDVAGTPIVRAPAPESWSRKYAAIASYTSQVRMLWPQGQDWVEALNEHALAHDADGAGELYWTIEQE